jgi:hypothetical protein
VTASSREESANFRFLAEHHPPERCCGTQTVMETALCKQLLNDLVGVSFSDRLRLLWLRPYRWIGVHYKGSARVWPVGKIAGRGAKPAGRGRYSSGTLSVRSEL